MCPKYCVLMYLTIQRCCIKNFLRRIALKSRQDILKNTNKKGVSIHHYEL